MRITFLFICLVSLASFGQELNKDNDYYKMYNAAEQAKANNAEGIRTLYKMSLEDQKNPEINKMLIKSTMLGMIRSNSKILRKYILMVDSKFIALDPMGFLSRSPLQAKCFKCKGETILKFPCKYCYKGKCKNCKGTKQIVYRGLGGKVEVRKCIPCEATGECKNCDHSGMGQKGCHVCVEKGTVFSGKSVPAEYVKSLDNIISFMPKYAAGKNILINDKMVELSKQNKLKQELEEAERLAAKKRAEERAAREAERKVAMEQRAKKAREVFSSAPKATGRNANLQHVMLEFNQFFRNRERISKQSIYEEATAEFKDNKPTLLITVTGSVGAVDKALKIQYMEAFYYFFKLRVSSNGLGKSVGMTATYRKKEIAISKDGGVVLQ